MVDISRSLGKDKYLLGVAERQNKLLRAEVLSRENMIQSLSHRLLSMEQQVARILAKQEEANGNSGANLGDDGGKISPT